VPDSSLSPTRTRGPSRREAGGSADAIAELASHLQRTRETERAALARELHDELGAILTAARLDTAWLLAQPGCADPAIAQRLQALQRLLAQGIGLKRRIVEDLHPTVLTHLGLVPALEQLLASHRERFTGRMDVEIDPTVELSGDAALALYRIVQESLTNILKYSQARHVRIALRRARGRVELVVEDDGRGFDPEAVGSGRHGLAGMRHRMLAVRGRLQIASAPGAGTEIRASLPASGVRATAPAVAGQVASVQRRAPSARRRHAEPARPSAADAPSFHP
jgi:signal transduction histidine kinase